MLNKCDWLVPVSLSRHLKSPGPTLRARTTSCEASELLGTSATTTSAPTSLEIHRIERALLHTPTPPGNAGGQTLSAGRRGMQHAELPDWENGLIEEVIRAAEARLEAERTSAGRRALQLAREQAYHRLAVAIDRPHRANVSPDQLSLWPPADPTLWDAG